MVNGQRCLWNGAPWSAGVTASSLPRKVDTDWQLHRRMEFERESGYRMHQQRHVLKYVYHWLTDWPKKGEGDDNGGPSGAKLWGRAP